MIKKLVSWKSIEEDLRVKKIDAKVRVPVSK